MKYVLSVKELFYAMFILSCHGPQLATKARTAGNRLAEVLEPWT